MPTDRQKRKARISKQSQQARDARSRCAYCGKNPEYQAGSCIECMQRDMLASVGEEKSLIATQFETDRFVVGLLQRQEKKIIGRIAKAALPVFPGRR